MSKLEELLQGVAVKWFLLCDVAQYIRGLTYNKTNESKDNSGLKVLRANNITLNNNSLNFDEIKYVNLNTKVKENQKLYCNDILISAASGSRDHVGKVAYINNDLDYYFGGFMGVIRSFPTVNSRYLFYILTSGIFKKYVDDALNTATINNLSSSMMNAFKIPIPCPDNPEKSLEIQQEIVRVLDELTSLTNQLTTELDTERQNRKKQFEFFREQLFRFEEGNIEFKTLGDITKLITKGTTPKIFSSNGINFIKIESFNNNKIIPNKFMFISKEIHEKELKRSILKSEDILFAIAGATIGKCAIVSEDILPANTNQALAIIRLNENINVKYIFNFLQSLEMKKYIEKFNKTSAQPNLNLKQISDFKIPIPSLAEQERIVKVLDQLDATHTAIEEEITKEIKLRTQQYEYYREKLLTFPEN